MKIHPCDHRSIIFVQTMLQFALGFVGVFLPFYLKEAFNLEWSEIFFLLGGMWLINGFVFPLIAKYGLCKYGAQHLMTWGLCWLFVFNLIIIFGKSYWLLIIALAVFTLYVSCFWNGFHYWMIHGSNPEMRGNLLGNIRFMSIGASLVTPIITTFFIDQEQSYIPLTLSAFILTIAIVIIYRIPEIARPQLRTSKAYLWSFFQSKKKRTLLKTFATEGFQEIVIGTLWPVMSFVVFGGLALFGKTLALMSGIEMIIAKLFGKYTDRNPRTNFMPLAAITRAIDIAQRSALPFFPYPTTLLINNSAAGMLGAFLNISFFHRFYHRLQADFLHPLEGVLYRDIALAITRGVTMLFLGTMLLFYSITQLWWIFIFTGIVTFFGYRKF